METRVKAAIQKEKEKETAALAAAAADTTGYTWNEFLADTTVPIKCWYNYMELKREKEPPPTPEQERELLIEQIRQYEQPAGATVETTKGTITIYLRP